MEAKVHSSSVVLLCCASNFCLFRHFGHMREGIDIIEKIKRIQIEHPD